MPSHPSRAQQLIRENKLRYLSHLHIRELYRHLSQIERSSGRRRIFSTDNSLLRGDYVAMVRRDNFDDWVYKSSEVGALLRLPYFRVMPLAIRHYSAVDIAQIKFALHTALSLGATIYLPVVESLDYLEVTFGEQNTLLVEDSFSIRGDFYYEQTDVLSLRTSKPDNIDLFLPYGVPSWRQSHNVIRLAYRSNSFATGVVRKEPLKEYYADFLATLQGGRCARCERRIAIDAIQVDHIYPASRGGNNTLINLQNLCGPCDRPSGKGDSVDPRDERGAWPDDLQTWGLDTLYPYSELSFRTRTTNPFGFIAL